MRGKEKKKQKDAMERAKKTVKKKEKKKRKENQARENTETHPTVSTAKGKIIKTRVFDENPPGQGISKVQNFQ